MADLNDLFSKFHSNRLKHQRRYEFTIQKYDQEIDDSKEINLNDDSDSDKIESSESDQDQIEEEESDKEELILEKKYINKYCNEIKRCMTSTPLYQDTIPLKSTILNGISPFLQSIKKNKQPAKQSNNILNTVRERNLLNKISVLTTPKANELNQSAVLCKPNKNINSNGIPHKLDFDFEISDDEDDNKEEGKKLVHKFPNMFESPNSHKDICRLSPPGPNNKLKEMLNRFGQSSKNSHPSQENNSLAKIHQDMELSVPSQTDELKEICMKFSQDKSAKNNDKKSPIIELDKPVNELVQNEENNSLTSVEETVQEGEENDKLSDLVNKFKKKIHKSNFMQSTPMESEKLQMDKLEISGLPIATPNEKMKKLAEIEENDKLSDLVNKLKKKTQKSNFFQSTPLTQKNVNLENLDFSGLPVATPNGKMKKLAENIQENNEMEMENNDENDQVPEMSKKFVHTKKTIISDTTPRSSLNRSSNKKNSKSQNLTEMKETDHLPEMKAKFKNVKKSSITESTPNPLSKSYQRNKGCLDDISKLSIRNDGNQINISASDSLNDEMPKITEKNPHLDMSESNSKNNTASVGDGKRLYEIFKNKKKLSALEQKDCDIINIVVDQDTNDNEVIMQKENLFESNNSQPKSTKNINKKSEKRILNKSNLSMERKKPDLKKICLEHYQNKVLDEWHQDSSRKITLLQSSKNFVNKNRPDIHRMCQDKFKLVNGANENKLINIGKATCFLGREFTRYSKKNQK